MLTNKYDHAFRLLLIILSDFLWS